MMEELEDLFPNLVKLAEEAEKARIKPQTQEPPVCSLEDPECEACGS